MNVLITGAANGIGFAITNFLATKNVHVFATDVNKEALQRLESCVNVTPIFMDVTNSISITEARTKIEKLTNGLDGLINNAGIFVGGPLVELEETEIEKIMSVNVLGCVKVTKIFFPLLFKNKGRIINIGSECGRFSFPLNGPYTMTKYALEAFSDTLRRELMFLEMPVVLLQIGAMNTPLLQQTYSSYKAGVDLETTHFKKLLQTVIKFCEKESTKSSNPIEVAKVVYKVLNKKHLKPRYRIKNDKARRILEFLPTRIADLAIQKTLKK